MAHNEKQSGYLQEKLNADKRLTQTGKGGRIISFTAKTEVSDGNGRIGF
ncbi:30S ribosomal protein S5, partial [Erwinia amylovora]|nr:30S ribosomal protein S5 [Erwinia amylovora]